MGRKQQTICVVTNGCGGIKLYDFGQDVRGVGHLFTQVWVVLQVHGCRCAGFAIFGFGHDFVPYFNGTLGYGTQ